MKEEFYPLHHLEAHMSKIDLKNISHSYNPNDLNPTYALNPFSMTWKNGNRYEGDFVKGLRTGKGEYSTAKYIYNGDFKENKGTGFGKIVFSNIGKASFTSSSVKPLGKRILRLPTTTDAILNS